MQRSRKYLDPFGRFRTDEDLAISGEAAQARRQIRARTRSGEGPALSRRAAELGRADIALARRYSHVNHQRRMFARLLEISRCRLVPDGQRGLDG